MIAAYCIPYLQFDGLSFARYRLRTELHTDGGVVFLLEFVVGKLQHQTALAHICVTWTYLTRQ